MPETWPAFLHEIADGDARMLAVLTRTPDPGDPLLSILTLRARIAQLRELAELLERVTPEMVNDLRLDMIIMTGCDEPAVGTKDALSILRALAAGPAREEASDA